MNSSYSSFLKISFPPVMRYKASVLVDFAFHLYMSWLMNNIFIFVLDCLTDDMQIKKKAFVYICIHVHKCFFMPMEYLSILDKKIMWYGQLLMSTYVKSVDKKKFNSGSLENRKSILKKERNSVTDIILYNRWND